MLLDKDKINELIFEGAHGDTPDNIVKKAGSGDKVSQRILGEMYYRGELLEENFELARMWFTKAARQEDQAAISWLAGMDFLGQGGKINYEQSYEEWDSIKNDYSLAFLYLSVLLATGLGCVKSIKTSAQYLYEYISEDVMNLKDFLDFERINSPFNNNHWSENLKTTVVGELKLHIRKLKKSDNFSNKDKNDLEKKVIEIEKIFCQHGNEYSNQLKCGQAFYEKHKMSIIVHEAGHALINEILNRNSVDEIEVTLNGENDSIGHITLANDDKPIWSKQDYLNNVCSLLAGNCALEIFYSNSNCIDDGASDDIYRVLTDIYRMIGKYGMSEYSKLPMLELNDIDITSQMRNDIWKEANKIVNEQYGRCLKLIKSNFKFFNLLINAIKDKPYTSSKLSKDEIANILIANDIKLIINE